MPLVEYLREHHHLHTAVTVTQERVDLWTAEMGLPMVHEAMEVPTTENLVESKSATKWPDIFMVLNNCMIGYDIRHNDIYVKYADYFMEKKGHVEDWGRSWLPVKARDIEDARSRGLALAKQGLLKYRGDYRTDQRAVLGEVPHQD